MTKEGMVGLLKRALKIVSSEVCNKWRMKIKDVG